MTEVIVTKTQHASITDPNIHNPKGFASASNQTTLIKNINGVLQWVSGYNYLSSIHMYNTSPYNYQFIEDGGRYYLESDDHSRGVQDNILTSIEKFKTPTNNTFIRYTSSHSIVVYNISLSISKYCDWIVTNILTYYGDSWHTNTQYSLEYYGNPTDYGVMFAYHNTPNLIYFDISLPDAHGITYQGFKYTRKLYFQYI
jgi:hypothetical protein